MARSQRSLARPGTSLLHTRVSLLLLPYLPDGASTSTVVTLLTPPPPTPSPQVAQQQSHPHRCRRHCCFAAAAIFNPSTSSPVVSPFCSICLSALLIKRRSSARMHTNTNVCTHPDADRMHCLCVGAPLRRLLLPFRVRAARRGSRFILGLRALASIPDSAACIILAHCPDYASAASLAPLDGVSFFLAWLVFCLFLGRHTLLVRGLRSLTDFCLELHSNQYCKLMISEALKNLLNMFSIENHF